MASIPHVEDRSGLFLEKYSKMAAVGLAWAFDGGKVSPLFRVCFLISKMVTLGEIIVTALSHPEVLRINLGLGRVLESVLCGRQRPMWGRSPSPPSPHWEGCPSVSDPIVHVS